ncbi:MAG: PD-(D/E)XK nuclease family protein [Bacteroidales bacterium]|nr:PD-(D/E)XK nuclease family protein [Bacteroidales bacterium]
MKGFLYLVVQSLLKRFGSDMSRVTVVFPGKRASLFFDQILAECSPTPVWAPRYTTISELFRAASPFTLCDTIEGVCRLHEVYARQVEDPQSLDLFYNWGEVLLADFDDVDKHLVDAHRLFTNIRDVKALDDNAYITPEQEEALRSFFSDFSLEDNTLLKERFLRLWNHMAAIYDDLNASMRADGLLYEGALHRDVIQSLRRQHLASDGSSEACPPLFPPETTYVFVGFNVLNDVEEALFDELQHRGQALFFWDYDQAYLNPSHGKSHEAGYFIRRNMERYGNELPPESFDNLRHPKQLTIVATSSENAQARYIPQWLEARLTSPEQHTAVVLANENLLLPVLYSIPPKVKALNVTMGYPLTDTPVFSFVNLILSLHIEGFDAARTNFRPSYIKAVASHPFAHFLEQQQWLCGVKRGKELLVHLNQLLSQLGLRFAEDIQAPETPMDDDQRQTATLHTLYSEAVFSAYTAISRIIDLMSGPHPLLVVNDFTLRHLVASVLQTQSVPFHGEPAVGLQVMGVLETRALDFDHILLLSVGEGYLPKSVSDTSLIPYHLKEAFGLTTIRHKIAVYAYYFYRLIQRAGHVTFMYNESNAGTRQNERSRFLRQLEGETDFPILHQRLQAANKVVIPSEQETEKTPEVMQALLERFDCTQVPQREIIRHILSPSALNKYTACPMKFYYYYVKKLSPDNDLDEGFQASHFGSVFHRSAELIYRSLTEKGDVVRQQDIDRLIELGGQALQPFISKAFRDVYFEDRPEEYTGILIIARRVIETYLLRLLRYDRALTPMRILGLEHRVLSVYEVQAGAQLVKLQVGGIIDRFDQIPDSQAPSGHFIRVVDYKTGSGSSRMKISDLDSLFCDTDKERQNIFQSFLYATLIERLHHEDVQPCLFFPQLSAQTGYSPAISIGQKPVNTISMPVGDDQSPLNVAFNQRLQTLLNEIFNPEVPFIRTPNRRTCESCDFRILCSR